MSDMKLHSHEIRDLAILVLISVWDYRVSLFNLSCLHLHHFTEIPGSQEYRHQN